VEENEDDAHWTSSGINQVVYRISTNAGETMRPLEQIASGGELSRVMLALKASVEAGTNSAGHSTATTKKKLAAQRTLVFDEIDTGIGGRAAEAVGKKIEGALQGQSGFVRHAFAADCDLCGSPLRHREARGCGPG